MENRHDFGPEGIFSRQLCEPPKTRKSALQSPYKRGSASKPCVQGAAGSHEHLWRHLGHLSFQAYRCGVNPRFLVMQDRHRPPALLDCPSTRSCSQPCHTPTQPRSPSLTTQPRCCTGPSTWPHTMRMSTRQSCLSLPSRYDQYCPHTPSAWSCNKLILLHQASSCCIRLHFSMRFLISSR